MAERQRTAESKLVGIMLMKRKEKKRKEKKKGFGL